MKINCLCCGHSVELNEAYSDYKGTIKCYTCSALLEVKLDEGRVRSVKFLELTGSAAT